MKRKLAILLVLALCAMLMPVQASAAQTSYTSSTGITINVDMSPFSFDPGYGTIYYVGEQMIKMRATDSQGNTVYQVRDFDGNVMCELGEDEFFSLKRFSEGLAWVQVYDEWTGTSGWGCISMRIWP